MARLLSGTKKGQRRKTARRAYMKTATPTRRKRRTTSKKGLLSELFDKRTATAGAKAVVSGAIGGGASVLIEKVFANSSTDKQALITGVAGFVTATILKMPNVGAGMGAIALYKYMDHAGMLDEDGSGNWADISSLPAVLNENGIDLQECSLQEDDIYLQDWDSTDYDVGYYGAGFGG